MGQHGDGMGDEGLGWEGTEGGCMGWGRQAAWDEGSEWGPDGMDRLFVRHGGNAGVWCLRAVQ